MNTFRLVAISLLVAGLAACGVEMRKPLEGPPEAAVPLAKLKEVTPSLNVGDVEASVRLAPAVGHLSEGPNVKVDTMRDQADKVLMTTVDVAAPVPTQFQVTFRFECSRVLEQIPVAMRVKFFRDKDVMASTAVFFDAKWGQTPKEQTFDVLAGLSAVPPTMLLHAEADLVMLPPGTDTANVDPNTVTGPPDMTGVIVGSPMRINFGPGGATP